MKPPHLEFQDIVLIMVILVVLYVVMAIGVRYL